MSEKQKNKIVLIIPYFGELPEYFAFFLKGCENNVDVIDIVFIHDKNIFKKLPSNVYHYKLSLSNFNEIATSKLGYEINVSTPYKLCDFKPVYGHIFEDYIQGYEFWGYGDVDLIFGDLGKFVSLLNLKKYDLFTFREYIISGALTIMKNNVYFKFLYLKSPNIKEILTSEQHFAFDESGGKIAFCRKRKPAFDLLHIDNIVCWTSIIQKEFYDGRLNLYSKYELIESVSFGDIFLMSNREITRGLDEFVAYHLVTEKKISKFVIPRWSEIPGEYYITSTGFYKKNKFQLLYNFKFPKNFI
jgi:hypothetical protein